MKFFLFLVLFISLAPAQAGFLNQLKCLLGPGKDYYRKQITVAEWKARPQGSDISPDHVPMAIEIGYDLGKSQLSYTPLKPLKGRTTSEVESILRESEFTVSLKMMAETNGINEKSILSFENGVKGVWKPHVEEFGSNYRTEVLAYEFDRLIGFDLVPPTVERKIAGRKGSIQLFEKKVEDYNSAFYKNDLDKQSLFDYLISNTDRHNKNYLFLRDNKIASIDHGISFDGPAGSYGRSFKQRKQEIIRFLETDEGEKVLARLKELDLDRLHKEVTDYIGEEAADSFISRIHYLFKFLEKRENPSWWNKVLNKFEKPEPPRAIQ